MHTHILIVSIHVQGGATITADELKHAVENARKKVKDEGSRQLANAVENYERKISDLSGNLQKTVCIYVYIYIYIYSCMLRHVSIFLCVCMRACAYGR